MIGNKRSNLDVLRAQSSQILSIFAAPFEVVR